MADTKISALPASTTPLAGTEVLPIVQSGATKQVSVANLTAGRSVSMLQGNATNAFQVSKTGSDTPWAGPHLSLTNAGSGAGERVWAWQISAADQLDLLQYDGANWNRWFRFTSDGNLAPMASAKGINFTANTPAAGMTSQLLNWYEEGTWTPAQGAGLTVVGIFSSVGKYVRIGNQVTVYARLYGQTSLACNAGGILTNNLPFNVGGTPYAIGSLTNATSTATNTVQGVTSNVYLNGTVTATTEILFTLTYFV